jgi:hypothetical protein
MEIGDTLTFKSGLPQAESVDGEVGIVSAVETRDGQTYINVTFPLYGEFVGVSTTLFETQN